jgi:hypothetical protein
MTRRSGRDSRRRGRPYQPYPQRSNTWIARLVVVIVGLALVITVLAYAFTR